MLETYRVALNALYCDNNGRPATDPVLLQGVLVLQFIERMPDRQAAEAVQYNTCWKLALNLSLDAPSFDPSLLVVFRKRLLTGGLESLIFQAGSVGERGMGVQTIQATAGFHAYMRAVEPHESVRMCQRNHPVGA